MFYILGIAILVSLSLYISTTFFISKRPFYEREENKIELFKEEEENLKSNKNLSIELVNLLIYEREQNLLQEVPREKPSAIYNDKIPFFPPILLSLFTFLVICIVYFQPISLGSLYDLKSHNIIYGFLDAQNEERSIKRNVVVYELQTFIDSGKSTASELYFLSNKFVEINEFLLSSLLLEKLVTEYHKEIPLDLYSEYAQVLFFKEGKIFSEDVNKALDSALFKSPTNPIALTLKGIKHFQAGETALAKISWGEAKKYTKNPREKKSIQQAIDSIDLIKNQ